MGWHWCITNYVVRFYSLFEKQKKILNFYLSTRRGVRPWVVEKNPANKKNSMGRGSEAARSKSFETRTKTRSQINAVKLNRSQGNIKPRVPRGPRRFGPTAGGFDLLRPEKLVPCFESMRIYCPGCTTLTNIPVYYNIFISAYTRTHP